jgi:membrane associated rhomboid family serine protease
VFLVELSGGDQFIEKWAFIPSQFSADPFGRAATIFTAMFMHGGWLHLLGNMLYLWIFGDNVEDRFGHIQFLLFYLLVGIAATLTQYAMAPHSSVPNLGASGAIAGVLGAYILMFPQSRVNVLLGTQMVAMPALIVIGFWIALQLFSEIGTFANTSEGGGVAYMAHIGGFLAGFLLTFLFRGAIAPQT